MTDPTPEQRITALEADLEDFRALLAGVLNAPPAATGPAPPPPPAPTPQRWADRATADDQTALFDWVDALTDDYSLSSDWPMKPCWPAHPGVVEELAAVWRAWIPAAIADDAAGADGSGALTAWHTQWLWPCMKRITKDHYGITSCKPDKHEAKRSNRPLTDRFIAAD